MFPFFRYYVSVFYCYSHHTLVNPSSIAEKRCFFAQYVYGALLYLMIITHVLDSNPITGRTKQTHFYPNVRNRLKVHCSSLSIFKNCVYCRAEILVPFRLQLGVVIFDENCCIFCISYGSILPVLNFSAFFIFLALATYILGLALILN